MQFKYSQQYYTYGEYVTLCYYLSHLPQIMVIINSSRNIINPRRLLCNKGNIAFILIIELPILIIAYANHNNLINNSNNK